MVAFLQILQVYFKFVFLEPLAPVLFGFAGLEPHLFLFPVPGTDLFKALWMDPLFKLPLFAPVFTIEIFCSVCFLHLGQYLFVIFGIFILLIFLLLYFLLLIFLIFLLEEL